MKRHFFVAIGLSLQISLLMAQIPKWDHIPGPDGGDIQNFDLDGASLYALTHAGIYRSDDQGYHWQLLPHSLATTRDKRQLRAENGLFYALTSEGSLVRSEDQGKSWKSLLQKPFPFNFEKERLQRLFAKGDTLLVGSLFTIYRSTNRGENWTSTADLVPASFVSIFEFKNELFAAQDRYIYRSSDGGMTWDSVFANAVGYAEVVATDSFLLAFYAHKNRLVRSTDGLRTWDAIDTDTLAKHLEEDPYGAYPLKWVGGSGNNLYYFQLGDVHYYCPFRFCFTNDGGNTWHRGNNGNQVPIGSKLNDGINFGNHIVLGSNQVQHSIDNAHTFFTQQEGLKCGSIWQVIYQDGAFFSTINNENGFRSTNKGGAWEPCPFPVNGVNHCRPLVWFSHTDKRMFRFQRNGYLTEESYSEDQGQTWKALEIESSSVKTTTNHSFWYQESVWSPSGRVNEFWRRADTDTSFTLVQLSGPNFNDFYSLGLISLGDRLGVEAGNDFYI